MNAKPNKSTKIAIRQVQVEHLNLDIPALEGYQQVMVVFRFKGVVVGTAWFPVENGKVRVAKLHSAVSKIAWPTWQQIMMQLGKPSFQLPSVTVVVCTRNRTSDLAEGLPALVKLAGQGHQVLVVDNGPSDDSTARLVTGYPEIEYICEARAGLDIARNRGIIEASSEVVAFVDDDAIPDEGWVDALRENFADPMVAVVTGITLPLELETQAQQWFEITNGFSRGFERQHFDSNWMSVLGAGRVGAGVNMAIRRSLLGEIGLFDEALDGGTPTLSGGDQEFYYRVLAHGYRIVYDPRALVWHKHRREWKALRNTIFGYGVGLFAWWSKTLFVDKEFSLLYWAPMWFIQHHLGNLIRSAFKRPGSIPLDLAWAELCGAVIGPYRYLRSRKMQKRDTGLMIDKLILERGQATIEAARTETNLPASEVYVPGIRSGAEVP